jgi:hypothetical protein
VPIKQFQCYQLSCCDARYTLFVLWVSSSFTDVRCAKTWRDNHEFNLPYKSLLYVIQNVVKWTISALLPSGSILFCCCHRSCSCSCSLSLSLSLLVVRVILRPTVSRPVCLIKSNFGPWPDFCYCQALTDLFMRGALSDERTGLSFINIVGPRQRSHFRVRAPRDSWPYFTVWNSRLHQTGGRGPRVYIRQVKDGPVIPPATAILRSSPALNNIWTFSSYLTGNTLLLRYKDQSVNGV